MPFFLFFFLLGIISILSQVTILRELISQFYGNEFFVGLILGIWLLLVGLGSLLSEKLRTLFFERVPSVSRDESRSFFFKKFSTGSNNKKTTFGFLTFSFLLLPTEIYFIRIGFLKIFPQFLTPSIMKSFIFIFLSLLPICLLLGILFPLGVKIFKEKSKNPAGKAYLFETLGFAVGGLLFNFFLINSSFPIPEKINNFLLKQKFPSLVKSIYSKYGHLTVTRQESQYNFYENGKLFATSEQTEEAEYKIHLIFAHHANPEKILLIGNGFSQIKEILKYSTTKQIDYLELDPEILKIAPDHLSLDLQKVLKDPSVKPILVDPRFFLRQNGSKYDLVIFNLPNPSTAFVNRLYTKECFQLVKNNLMSEGIFAFSIYVPVDYLSSEAAKFAALVNQTTKTVFSFVKILPEDSEILFLATDNDIFNQSWEEISQRFEKRNLELVFFTLDYLNYRLANPAIDEISKLLESQKEKQVNTDFQPLAYFYQTAFWQTMYDFGLAKFFGQIGLLNFNFIIFIIFITLIITQFIKVKKRSQLALLSVTFVGFNLMALEILIIYAFQATLGYVFARVALIFALILGGMALGNWLSYKLKVEPTKLIFYIYFIFLIFYILFFILITVPHELVFYSFSVILGFLSGFIFPSANRIFARPGILYTADLFGSFLGAILPSIFLIPLFGVKKTIVFLGLINLSILGYLGSSSKT